MSNIAGASTGPPVIPRLHRFGRAWRSAALLLLVVLIVRGTLVGRDEDWPFAPMGQYAFSVPDNGEIRSPIIEAVTVAGKTVPVPLSADGVGVRRAEIEGQIPAIEKEPWRLQALAVQAAQRHPQWPRYATVRLVDNVTQLRGGRVADRRREVLATWSVVNPADPQPVRR